VGVLETVEMEIPSVEAEVEKGISPMTMGMIAHTTTPTYAGQGVPQLKTRKPC
jgi:hypothetical protein